MGLAENSNVSLEGDCGTSSSYRVIQIAEYAVMYMEASQRSSKYSLDIFQTHLNKAAEMKREI